MTGTVILNAMEDCLSMIPFLFAAFLFVEWMEHRAKATFTALMQRAGKAGPLIGSLLGCLPQCGFSVLSSNLFAAGLITMGTLLSVFLATSDEAILILLSNPGSLPVVGALLLCKLVIAILVGFLTDLLYHPSAPKEIHAICTDCGCGKEKGILRPALHHTVRILLFVFLITLCIDFLMEIGGENLIRRLLLTNSVWQPLLTALVGLIPGCAVSVLLTRLYLEGILSFGAAVAGLSTGAGVGLLVLFRMNRNRRENFQIAGLLYLSAAVSGMLIQRF